MTTSIAPLIVVGVLFFVFAFIVSEFQGKGNINAKRKIAGDRQHGDSRWATEAEMRKKYEIVTYEPDKWRKGENLPKDIGIIIHSEVFARKRLAYVETDDVHTLMKAASGSGKTAYFLYPNIEYACACGASFITTDTKGDLYRNYGTIAEKYYGYKSTIIDLRNPTRSHGDNMLHLVNLYMDRYIKNPDDISSKARAEKQAKVVAKSIIKNGAGDNYGANSYFYDSAEGLIASVLILLAEFAKPEERHIVSAFKLIQDLMQPSSVKGKTRLQVMLDLLPEEHMARMLAGSALYTAEQAMLSVTSTALSRLNAFLDSEIQQILCFDTEVDLSKIGEGKQAIFLVMPEEDNTKYFLISLMLVQMYEEVLATADALGGKLQKRVLFFLDEIGTIEKIETLPMMLSAGRSRNVLFVPIIQNSSQLKAKYGPDQAENIEDNCKNKIRGGFPADSADIKSYSESLGTQTVTVKSVTKSKEGVTETTSTMAVPLMSENEILMMGKNEFIVKTNAIPPIRAKLDLFLDWGITFEEPYTIPDKGARKVHYANKDSVEEAIIRKYQACVVDEGMHDVIGSASKSMKGGGEQIVLEIEPDWGVSKKYPKVF